MIRRISIIVLSLIIVSSSALRSQERKDLNVERERSRRLTDIYFNISSSGTGLGLKFYRQTDNPDLKFSLGVQLSGVRGENEYSYIDPYNYNYIKGNKNFWTMMAPVTVGFKRRLWREAIEGDFRPFVMAEAGPVFGMAFPTGDGFKDGLKKGQGQVTGGLYVGFGVDLGNEGSRLFGLTIGMHVIPFQEALGEKKTYTGFDIRINMLNHK